MMDLTKWTMICLALGMIPAGLGGPAKAQEAQVDGVDLTPPDLSAPRGEREYRTCPDREERPAWLEGLKGYDAERGLLLMSIYEARTYEAIVSTGDCSCLVKAPPWDAAEAEYQDDYAALDLPAVDEAEDDFSRLARSLYRDVRRICREQGNW